MSTLHIHADEAGDFNFKAGSGTAHYTFAVVWTGDPYPLAENIRSLRFELVKKGLDVSGFHACTDRRKTREAVCDLLLSCDTWRFCAVVVDKSRVFQYLRSPDRFYPQFLSYPLKFVLRGRVPSDTSRVLVYTDRLPNTNAKKEGIEKAIHASCASELKRRQATFRVFHHPSVSNAWLQVADYCCWALHRKYEKGDDSWYSRLRPRLAAPELFLWN